jgi:hypothetical protein
MSASGVLASSTISDEASMFGRAFLIWLLLMAAESVHGILRELLLAPVMGDIPARRLSVLTGAVLIFLITLATVRWIGAGRTNHLLRIGLLWVVLTVVFEISLGRLVLHSDWQRIASDYDLASGGLMIPGLACMLLTPWVAARLRKVSP